MLQPSAVPVCFCASMDRQLLGTYFRYLPSSAAWLSVVSSQTALSRTPQTIDFQMHVHSFRYSIACFFSSPILDTPVPIQQNSQNAKKTWKNQRKSTSTTTPALSAKRDPLSTYLSLSFPRFLTSRSSLVRTLQTRIATTTRTHQPRHNLLFGPFPRSMIHTSNVKPCAHCLCL